MFDAVLAGHDGPVVGPASFAVRAGEIVGLTGPNGCGKSTLLGALTRTAQVFRGRVERRSGLTVALQRQRLVRLGDLPITGHDLLRLGRALEKPVPASLEPLQCVRLDQLSGGQVQLLYVWAALGGAADLILLDEPTNNMDPRAVSAVVEILQGIEATRGAIVVSHDHGFLERVCTSIVEVHAYVA